MPTARRAVAALASLLLSGAAAAQDFIIDPATGTPGGNGSAAQPWRTLAEVVAANLIETRNASGATVNAGAPVKAGDTLRLRTGYHGDVTIQTAFNAAIIAVVADTGHTPALGRLLVRSAARWRFAGLSVSPSHRPTYQRIDIVRIEATCREIDVDGCEVFSVADASAWSIADWISTASSGISSGGNRIRLTRNRVRNVRFGISSDGDEVLVARNTVDGFSADGIRGLGDRSAYEHNLVKNCYVTDAQGDGNHDDGFQSWSFAGSPGEGSVTDVILRGNVFINHDATALPLQAPMQGIGCFDGFYDRWVVEDNVVVTDHWHGISLYGLRDGRIVNNTVIDAVAGTPGPPWVKIATHKTRGPSERSVARNNLAQGGTIIDAGQPTVSQDHNRTVTDLAACFVDAAARDLRLKAGSPAIDAGAAALAPPFDRLGVARPQGAAVDQGAHESGGTPAANVAPLARLWLTPSSGMPPLTVAAVASTSGDDDGVVVAAAWDFGDGAVATGLATEHAFTVAGTYTVRLTVTDDDGATGETAAVVTVGGAGGGSSPGSVPSGGSGRGGCGLGSGMILALGSMALAALRRIRRR